MTAEKLKRLQTGLGAAGLDAIALNPGPGLLHLTGMGFHLMERPVVLLVARNGDPVVVAPAFEHAKLAGAAFKIRSFLYGENPAEWGQAFSEAIAAAGLAGKCIGVEHRQMRLLEYEHLRAADGSLLIVDASSTLADQRVHKDLDEIQKMREAVRIAEQGLEALIPNIKVGQTEREIAALLTIELLKHGSDSEFPFAPIVAAGSNSADPHAIPTDRPLATGDLLVVDWGASYRGYISDLTRTFALGSVAPELQRIADVVLHANAAGRAAGRPGAPCAEVDRAARAVIEAAGYGSQFTHRTGHGIGLEGHEEPYIRGDNKLTLEVGMAYTVEPGIYLAGKGGVRIEDNVVITPAGVDVLSSMPRELRCVG